jgi:uncharacterized membrane protein
VNKLAGAYMEKSSAVLSKLPSFVAIIIVLQVALYLTFFFDIAVARQVVGFIYLTFIPGFVILKLLKQDNLGLAETVLFSVGLSVAFVMLVGLVINELGLLVGIKQPLEPLILVLVISGFVLFGALACYFKGSHDLQPIGLTKNTIVKSFMLCLLPVLTIVGAYFANVTENTSILLFALVAVLAVFAVAVFSTRLITPKLYFIVVFVIAITLLFQYSLMSNYVQGFDIKGEYYVATLTQSAGLWNATAFFTNLQLGRFYGMLSITILPTIYSNILNMDITWVFKIVYPLIFALVPLALYLLWRGKFGAVVAFFSAFFFMSQLTFYTEMLGLERQMIGEVFLVLLLIVLFSKSLSPKNVKILFLIFGFCLIVSHYSLALLFAFFISVIWLLGYFTKKPNRYLSSSMVVLFLVLMFSWYAITVSSATITSIAQDLSYIVSGFSNFFNLASRGTSVLAGAGLVAAPAPLNDVSRAIAYATEVFIIIGFLVLLLQRKKKDFEYFIPCAISMLILAMCILIPNFANTLDITRFYHVLLFFLAPFFAIGCVELSRFVAKLFGVAAKRKMEIYSLILMTLLLGAYFLFQTTLIYKVTASESVSLPLGGYWLGSLLYTESEYVTGPQVSSAKWLSQNANESNLVVYADSSVSPNLVAYGGIYTSHVLPLTNFTSPQLGQFIYLAELNTVYNEIQYNNGDIGIYNASYTLASQPLSVFYNNGFCEILTATTTAP